MQDFSLSSAVLNLSKNGMLVLEASPPESATFRVKQANSAVQKLVAGWPAVYEGMALNELPAPLNDPLLRQKLQQAPVSGTPQPFTLTTHIALSGSSITYTGQLVRADAYWVLTLERVENPLLNEQPQVILEALPTGLLILQSVRDTAEEVSDFRVVFCNQLAANLTGASQAEILTRLVGERYREQNGQELFGQYLVVATTGKPFHKLYYWAKLDSWIDVSVVTFADGLMVTFKDVTMGKKNASLLESVLKSSPAAIRYYEAIRDDSGKIVDFLMGQGNELAIYRSLRVAESTIGKRALEIYPYLLTDGRFDRYVRVVETGESEQFEMQRLINGENMWFDCTAVRHGDGLVLTSLNITSGKEAQRALQQQAELLQTVLDNSLAGMAWLKPVVDASGKVTDFLARKVNLILARLLSTTPDAIEGRLFSEIVPFQMRNGLFERYAQVAETGQSQRFEWQSRDGKIWHDLSVIAFEDGILVSFLDITNLKLAHLAQQRQADLLANVVNNSPNSILFLESIADEDGRVVDFQILLSNAATLRMLPQITGQKQSPEDLTQYTLAQLLPDWFKHTILTRLAELARDGEPIRRQRDFPDLGVSYAFDVTPLQTGLLIITSDITPLRQYQQKLEEKNAALSRSNEHLQQFAYVASHDLQEPLRKIQSFSHLLQNHYGEQLGDGVDYLQRMQLAAQRMSNLIKDLLAFSRLSIQPIEPGAVELDQVLNATLNDLEFMIQEKKAVITADPLPIIQGDSSQLYQLFLNLLSNAIKFCADGVAPRVRIQAQQVKATELPTQVLPTQAATGYHCVTVADNGIGFDEKYLDRIFQVFQRLHGKNEFAGTGVGLAICQKVVANHGGGITATSQPGQGTTFMVYFPQ